MSLTKHKRMNGRLSLLWKILLCIAEAIGLGLGSGLFVGTFKRRFPYMFTNLSNIAVFVYFLFAIVWMLRQERTKDAGRTGRTAADASGETGDSPGVFAPVVKHMVTMAVTVTMIIAHIMLRDGLFEGGYLHVHLLFLHYITPLMTILDWLLFEEKGYMKKWEPLVLVAAPMFYFVWVLVSIEFFGSDFGADIASGKSPYPYVFINPHVMGTRGVAVFVLVAAAGFLALGCLMYAIDRVLAKTQKERG